MGDLPYIVPLEKFVMKDSLTYEYVPVEMLNVQIRRLRNKKGASVKAFSMSQPVKGST